MNVPGLEGARESWKWSMFLTKGYGYEAPAYRQAGVWFRV